MPTAKKKKPVKKSSVNSPKKAVQSSKGTKTSTATKTATKTSTSTDAYTQGNITVTGGAGKGATRVNIMVPRSTGAPKAKKAKKSIGR